MRDKEDEHNMNQTFTDLAWRDMEKVLDREMPVERKKRRAIIWFWAAAGLFLLISAGIFLFGQQRNMVSPVQHDQFISFDVRESPDSKAVIAQNDIIKNESSTQINSKTNETAEKKDPNSRNKSDVLLADTYDKNGNKSISPIPGGTERSNAKSLTNTIKKIPEEEALITPEINSAIDKHSEATTAIAMLDEVFPERAFTFSKNAVLLAKGSIPQILHLRAYTNSQSAGLSTLQGYEVGITISKNLPDSRWSISFGVGFQSIIKSLDVQTGSYFRLDDASSFPASSVGTNNQVFIDLFSADQQFSLDANNGVVHDNLSYGYATDLNVQLHYLVFPINIRYKVNTRLSLTAGITPSNYLKGSITTKEKYLNASRSDANIYDTQNEAFGNQSEPLTSIPIANNYFYFTSKAVAPAKIRRWQFPVHLGTEYQLTRHFGLTFDFQSDVRSITNKGYIRTEMKRFRLGGYWAF